MQPQIPLQSSFNTSDAAFISEEINAVDGTTVDYVRLKTDTTQVWYEVLNVTQQRSDMISIISKIQMKSDH